MRARDIGDLVLVGAIWGGSFPLLKVAAPQFGPLALIAVRLLSAAVLLLTVWRVFAQLREYRGRLLVLGLINTAVPFTLFAFAALNVSAGINSLLNATTPLFAAIIGWLWLGERVAPLRLLGIGIAFIGIALIVAETLQLHSLADALANSSLLGILAGLGAGALYGLSACYTRRYLSDLSAAVSETTARLGLRPDPEEAPPVEPKWQVDNRRWEEVRRLTKGLSTAAFETFLLRRYRCAPGNAWAKGLNATGDYLDMGKSGNASFGHFVTVLGKTPDGKYLVADPLSKKGAIEVTAQQLGAFLTQNGWGEALEVSR